MLLNIICYTGSLKTSSRSPPTSTHCFSVSTHAAIVQTSSAFPPNETASSYLKVSQELSLYSSLHSDHGINSTTTSLSSNRHIIQGKNPVLHTAFILCVLTDNSTSRKIQNTVLISKLITLPNL